MPESVEVVQDKQDVCESEGGAEVARPGLPVLRSRRESARARADSVSGSGSLQEAIRGLRTPGFDRAFRGIGGVASKDWTPWGKDITSMLGAASRFNSEALTGFSTAARGASLPTAITRGFAGQIAGLANITTGVGTKHFFSTVDAVHRHAALGSAASWGGASFGALNEDWRVPARSLLADMAPLSRAGAFQASMGDIFKIGTPAQDIFAALGSGSRSWDTSVPTKQFAGVSESVVGLTRALTESMSMPSALSVGMTVGLARGLRPLDGLLDSPASLGVGLGARAAGSMLSSLGTSPAYDWEALSRSFLSEAAALSRGTAATKPEEGEVSRLVEERAESILKDDELLSQFERSSGLRSVEEPVARGVRLRAGLLRFARRAAYSPQAKTALVLALVWAHTNLPEAYDATGDWIEFLGLLWTVANAKPKDR